jgi:DNA-binding NarL/FixJ family response regulator
LLGGELDIISAPGKGTRVTLTAPIVFLEAPDHTFEKHIRLLIVDDHPVMRDGMARLFAQEPDIEVIGEASNGRTAVELAMKLIPDVILMDINMSGMNGIEATRIIRERVPQVKILGLSMMDSDDAVRAMLGAGASAHLSKSGSTEEIVKAVRSIVKDSDAKASSATSESRTPREQASRLCPQS